MHMIDVVSENLSSTVVDFLAGSALDPVPGDGALRVFCASSVDTANIAIERSKGRNPTGIGAQGVPIRANGEIRDYDPHWEMEVKQGEKVTITVAGTTGDFTIWASYMGAD